MFNPAALLVSAMLSGMGVGANGGVPTTACDARTIAPTDVLVCYDREIERQPLVYEAKGQVEADGVSIKSYLLTSQSWSPEGLVKPALWRHDVTLYALRNALPGRAGPWSWPPMACATPPTAARLRPITRCRRRLCRPWRVGRAWWWS